VLQGGESDHGSESYLAMLAPDGSLRWVAYFKDSNPLVAIDLHDKVATARSSNDRAFFIRMDATPFVPIATGS
jgi:hypothetical protein